MATTASATPETTQTKPTIKLTKRNIRKFTQDKYFENMPTLQEEWYKALVQGCKDGNPAVLRIVGQAAGILAKEPLVSITNNNTAVVQNASSAPASLEQLIRKLDSRDGNKTIDVAPALE